MVEELLISKISTNNGNFLKIEKVTVDGQTVINIVDTIKKLAEKEKH